jgi:hypothetical protein
MMDIKMINRNKMKAVLNYIWITTKGKEREKIKKNLTQKKR